MHLVDNYKEIVLADTPMIDVRAPVEFDKGSILGAANLPLMDNEQRHQVGICYKEKGQEQAIALGHQLVSGLLKQQRIEAWCQYFDQHPNTHLFCFRGGLRSKTTQQWINQTGRDIPLIKGGYKAMRTFLLKTLEQTVEQKTLKLISGKTGCGKTELLVRLNHTVDLEGLANHRGSSFGKQVSPQPSQINFENQIAKRLLQLQSSQQLILEDESRLIGRCALPDNLRAQMQQSKVYLLEDTFENRVERILQDYVINMEKQFNQQYGDDGFNQFSAYLNTAFNGIKRRLGLERHKALVTTLNEALLKQSSQNDADGHITWIEVLLKEYYDPIYEYQLAKKQQRIISSGDKEALFEQLQQPN